MAILAIDASSGTPLPHRGGRLRAVLAHALAELPPDAPVMILIHGYKFSPKTAASDPHRHILALKARRDCWKSLSWPRQLGFGRGRASEGLYIGFGWEARGTIWQAWRSAKGAGAALAELIETVRDLRPDSSTPDSSTGAGAPVHLVAHSLGARVALTAMAALPAGALGRVVLIAAAEFQSAALSALSSPAGRTAEVINVTSGENALFDHLLGWTVRRPLRADRPLGAGLWSGAENWLDLRVDQPATRAALAEFGFRIPKPKRRICHWWGYLRPGLLPMYRDLIRKSDALPLTVLRQALAPRPARSA
jgi:pimeloyl-ACP methyl ester carboxylesterase